MTTLHQAANQYATRPVDQRFNTLGDLHRAVMHHKESAMEAPHVSYKSLAVETTGGNLALVGPTGQAAQFTHFSFGQLAARIKAPANYLRQLPAGIAADAMNHGLQTIDTDSEGQRHAKLLLARNGSLNVRAFTGDGYGRIWDAEITSRLLRFQETYPQWNPAPEGMKGQEGGRGLYASDRDVWAFLVDNDRRVFEKAPGGGLSRGFIVSNSETGAASFVITTFLYSYICMNHLIWGAESIKELRIRHVGNAPERAFAELGPALLKYADASVQEDEAKIQRAQLTILGADKEAVLDAVFGLKAGLSKPQIERAYEVAEAHTDWYGNPRSVWGMVNGLTEMSQESGHMDARNEIDRAAAKVMQVAF